MNIIVGLDGCLARNEWRTALIETEGWEAYHAACINDAPNKAVVEIINALKIAGHSIFCCASRPEKWRMATTKWMAENGVDVHILLMRAENDWRKDEELRAEDIADIRRMSGEILFAIDDTEKACEVYRAAGITVLQLFSPSNGE